METVKIKKVTIENLKAISNFTALFDGKSAHVTGANGIGKSTLIRTLIDRLRGLKPSIITKIGEKEGKTVMELTDGCRFEWSYNDQGRDELNYFTPASLKPVKRDVFRHVCDQYFPNQFDINKFLTTTEPRKRLQMISELINVDLTEIQGRYKIAYDNRRDAKRDLKVLESQIRPKPEYVEVENSENLDIEQAKITDLRAKISNKKTEIEAERNRLNSIYLENKAKNEDIRKKHDSEYQEIIDKWIESERKIENEINEFNFDQQKKSSKLIDSQDNYGYLIENFKDSEIGKFIDFEGISEFIKNLPLPEDSKIYIQSPKPKPKELNLSDPMPSDFDLTRLKNDLEKLESDLENSINELESKREKLNELSSSKQVFELQLKQWNEFQKQVEDQSNLVKSFENEVENILNEIRGIIANTKLPAEFSIDLTDKNDILFKPTPESEYLPITVETLASSAIFIAAFKLQANYLESFRVAHFDVSYLDFDNRQKVLKEAINMNIQLITESPAMDENSLELQYKITEI